MGLNFAFNFMLREDEERVNPCDPRYAVKLFSDVVPSSPRVMLPRAWRVVEEDSNACEADWAVHVTCARHKICFCCTLLDLDF